jgi:hypothetical protein
MEETPEVGQTEVQVMTMFMYSHVEGNLLDFFSFWKGESFMTFSPVHFISSCTLIVSASVCVRISVYVCMHVFIYLFIIYILIN